MSYKLIVLIASGESEDGQVFDAAARLAKLQQGQVRVIPVYPDPAADLVYYGVSLHKANKEAAAARMRESEREIQAGIERFAREAASKHGLAYGDQSGLSIVVDQRDLDPAVALAEAAVLADVVVIGGGCARDFLNFSALFAQTLLTSRTPVFVAKKGGFDFDRVAIAWDGSNQAGRAVKAALPVLHTAKEIIVLQHPRDLKDLTLASDPATLVSYLARHGLTNVRVETVQGDEVAAALMAGARSTDCGLLIAGGYGRPRFLELVLGGTTRALVNAEGRPHLILAH
jgi:nucleotide-binding universal stress UspA family protein